jgi:hypothetical protein
MREAPQLATLSLDLMPFPGLMKLGPQKPLLMAAVMKKTKQASRTPIAD